MNEQLRLICHERSTTHLSESLIQMDLFPHSRKTEQWFGKASHEKCCDTNARGNET